jgi:hypothetical protein
MSRLPLVSLLLVSLVLAQSTSDKPDFSGRWRMIKEKSEFAGFKVPDIVTRAVEEHGIIMNVHTVQTLGSKTSIADVSYSIDGSPTQNVVNGRDAESKTFWDGPVLVIRTTMKTSKGEDEVIEDRWALSDDKQTLTTTSHIETDQGEVDMTLVCGRQDQK